MINEPNMGTTNQAIAGLENRLNELISVCAHLQEENAQLQNENATLLADRGQLMANRDKVRNQVEAMIGRLKAMESS
jgi:cell division protein ZapB